MSATNQSLGLIRKQYTAGAVTSTQVLIARQGYLSALSDPGRTRGLPPRLSGHPARARRAR
ncbi:hypothetical protein ACRAWG_09945 [Methylobacterium sp. P31]